MIKNSKVKIIINNDEHNKFLESLKKINKLSSKYEIFMGIDFEFNTKRIALMQIYFQINKKKSIKKKYYIVYPPIFNLILLDYFNNNIIANTNILKIVHGSESLDIPYILHELLDNNIDLIVNFFKSMVDTRYLCEYINLSENNKNICSLYELLFNSKVISNEEKNNLDLNEEKMGPIYNIIIDINKLTPELITYSIHDVVYLVDLYINLKDNITKKNKNDFSILCESVRFIFMERRYFTNIVNDIITLINKMNNYFYFLKINENYVKHIFIDTFNKNIKEYFNIHLNLNYIVNINYLKSYLLNLFRIITYITILKYYNVKESNIKIIDFTLDNEYQNIIDIFKYLEYIHLIDLLNDYYKFIDNKLKP